MSEIEVGEYVRINDYFRTNCIGIGKVVRKSYVDDTIYVDMSTNSLPIAFKKEQIVKHSKNIIDLIEAKDYVNGREVIEVKRQNGKIYLMTNYCPQEYIKTDIKTILTHEQYKQRCYEVGE